MADSNSPAFNPPINKLPPENDPQIVKVSMQETDWGFRKSQQGDVLRGGGPGAIKHIENGR